MKKIKNSFGGVIGGLILLVVGTCLLWWNEGNNVKNIATTNEVEKTAIEVKSDKVESNNEGKLVIVSDKLNVVDEKVEDPDFNVSTKTAKLKRKVEIYQWEETENTDEDGNTTYSYEKKWNEELIDSSNFNKSGHENPTKVEVSSETFQAKEVKIGAFELSSSQISSLGTSAKLNVKDVELKDDYTYQSEYVTTSKDLTKPEIGDIRISWAYNDWRETTILAVQKGDSFADFVSKNDKKVNRVEKGTLTQKEIIAKMRSENKFIKWLLRAVGALLIISGYGAILNPLSTLASFVPILGGLVGGLLGLLAFLIGIIHSLLIIVIAWFRFRPILSIALIAVIIGLVFAIRKLIKSKKGTVEQPVETTPEQVETEVQEPNTEQEVEQPTEDTDNNN